MQLVALYQGITLLCTEFAVYISIWLTDLVWNTIAPETFFPVQTINALYISINHLYPLQGTEPKSECNHKC